MAMLASFVQVDEELLEKIREDPSLAESLFEPEAGPKPDLEKMRETILARGPQLMAGALANLPAELRQQIEQRMGKTLEALRGGAGGDVIYRMMQEREGARAAGALAGRHGALSLDKDWHGLHYVLCGEAEPRETLLSQAVLGGTEVGEDFAGYGAARYFTATQVAELAQALGPAQVEQQAATRFDPKRMTELRIYPFGWKADDRERVMEAFTDLREFYAEAAARGWAVVTCLV